MADAKVRTFMTSTNRPWSVQLVVDHMQKHGLKKVGVTRALENLVDAGSVVKKEFGKSVLYMASQDGAEVLSSEEMEERSREVQEIEARANGLRAEVMELEKEARGISTKMTMEEATAKLEEVEKDEKEVDARLLACQGLAKVDPEERDKAAANASAMLGEWRKRRRLFADLFAPVEENCDNPKKLLKDMGVETDEAAGTKFKDWADLEKVHALKRRKF